MSKVPSDQPSKQIDYTDITPPCEACGERHVGLGTPVMLVIPGMLFPLVDEAVPVFIADPDVQINFMRMPNGMLGFIVDNVSATYVHAACHDDLIDQAKFENEPEEPEEPEPDYPENFGDPR